MNIVIPKGCACQNVEMGSYANQVELPTPPHMIAMGGIGCLTFYETICVDRCIADVVQALWAKGIVTTGCCCGHNLQDGYIGIHCAASGEQKTQLIRAYNAGYKGGHHDTVEGGYTDIHYSDISTYHADVIDALIADGTIALLSHPAAPAQPNGGAQ